MSIKVLSAAFQGLDAVPIEIEGDIAPGLGSFTIVGLPDAAVQESRERVRAAMRNQGLPFPRTRVTINLAPADMKKEGPLYDLPIALTLLFLQLHGDHPEDAGESNARRFSFPLPDLSSSLFLGELALDGAVRPVAGIISAALMAKRMGLKNLFVPEANALEAACIDGIDVFRVASLGDIVAHFERRTTLTPTAHQSIDTILATVGAQEGDDDFSSIRGQHQVKRAVEIAATGWHNMLMSGPPGSGKTMIARALRSVLPPLTSPEALEVTQVYSVAGLMNREHYLYTQRPFRSPHHTSSSIALVGGGTTPKPGEISLAHRGVLFLDELAEFSRSVLETLRQPLEDGFITVARAKGSVEYPARFLFVGATNPCPCGFYGDAQKHCVCTPAQLMKYRHRLSGPLLDRIDLHVVAPRVPVEVLTQEVHEESSQSMRDRIIQARELQCRRFVDESFKTNSAMRSVDVKKYCLLDNDAQQMLSTAIGQFQLSARAYFRILKVARTIADLGGGSEYIAASHVAEALQYRPQLLSL